MLKMGHYIKDSWAPPTIATLHWDGKLMESLDNKNICEEILYELDCLLYV